MKTDTTLPLISAEQREQFIRDGYVRVSGLIPPDVAASTRTGLLERMGVDPDAPDTWAGKAMSTDPDAIASTEACRTPLAEAAASELVGPDFIPGVTYSPYLDNQGVSLATLRGFIPVLKFPEPGPAAFEPPTTGYHIDGMHAVTVWPEKFFLVVFAYLSDTAGFGGATTVRPGSHRQPPAATGRSSSTGWQRATRAAPSRPHLTMLAPSPCRGRRAT